MTQKDKNTVQLDSFGLITIGSIAIITSEFIDNRTALPGFVYNFFLTSGFIIILLGTIIFFLKIFMFEENKFFEFIKRTLLFIGLGGIILSIAISIIIIGLHYFNVISISKISSMCNGTNICIDKNIQNTFGKCFPILFVLVVVVGIVFGLFNKSKIRDK